MKYRRIGNSDIQASEIGFGCMSLGSIPENSAAYLIQDAFNSGINYFDTADLYDKGENEKLLGRLLKPLRNQIIIATKVGNEWKEDGSGWSWNPRKDYILKAIDKSLQRLQTDYIDLYQLHGGTIEDNIDETVEAFEQLKASGKIRQYGISSIRPNVINEYVHRSSIVSVMMQYSLLDRRPEEEILPFLIDNNISILARGVLAQGLLINKLAKDYQGYTAKEVEDIQQQLKQREKRGYDKTGLSIQFALYTDAIASAVIGFRTAAQLNNVLNGVNHTIPASIIQELQLTMPAKKYKDHR